jgi:hypothetical protein
MKTLFPPHSLSPLINITGRSGKLVVGRERREIKNEEWAMSNY